MAGAGGGGISGESMLKVKHRKQGKILMKSGLLPPNPFQSQSFQ